MYTAFKRGTTRNIIKALVVKRRSASGVSERRRALIGLKGLKVRMWHPKDIPYRELRYLRWAVRLSIWDNNLYRFRGHNPRSVRV